MTPSSVRDGRISAVGVLSQLRPAERVEARGLALAPGLTLVPDALVGRQVAAVVNFPPRQVAKVMSEVLVLGFPDAEGRVVLVAVERPVR